MKIIDWDEKLFETLACGNYTAKDHTVLRKLAKWIGDVSGNVNVTMRLYHIADKMKNEYHKKQWEDTYHGYKE